VRLGLLLSGLRILGMSLRLVLAVFVVRQMGIDVFGRFSILLAVSVLAPPFVAMGFHFHVNRTTVGQPAEIMASGLYDRIALNLLIGLALSTAILSVHLFWYTCFLGTTALIVFLLICTLEAILVDAQLYLISCKKVIMANLMLFCRSSFWVVPLMGTWWIMRWQGLEPILGFWLFGNLLAVCILFFGLRNWPWRRVFRSRPSLKWQFANFRTSAGIWLSDVSGASIPLIERSLLMVILGAQQTGIYVFFWTLANGVQQIVVSATIQPLIPEMVAMVKNDMSKRFFIIQTAYKAATGALITLAFAAAMLVVVNVALPFMGDDELARHIYLFPLFLFAIVAIIISETLRIALYARRQDTALIASNLAVLVVSIALLTSAAASAGLVGASTVPLTVALISSLFRWWLLHRGG